MPSSMFQGLFVDEDDEEDDEDDDDDENMKIRLKKF